MKRDLGISEICAPTRLRAAALPAFAAEAAASAEAPLRATSLRPPTCLRRSEAPASRMQERASRRREARPPQSCVASAKRGGGWVGAFVTHDPERTVIRPSSGPLCE